VKSKLHRFFKNKIAMLALILFAILLLSCILAPLLCKYSYSAMDVKNRYLRPCREHLLGCDYAGRDLFSRILYGGRTTLYIAFTATLLSAILGLTLGIFSGYKGGKFDLYIMRLMEVLSSVPTLLLVILVECLLGWGKGNFRYALALSGMPPLVRLIRASTSQIMNKSYIEAAKALGVKGFGLVKRHILPNILPNMLVHITGTFAEQLLSCTIMGYVGVGINPPRAEWGLLVYEGYASLRTAPFIAVIPACVIAFCVLSVNLIGNGLRDALDAGDKVDG